MFIRRNVEDNRVKVYNVDAVYVILLSLLMFFTFYDVFFRSGRILMAMY